MSRRISRLVPVGILIAGMAVAVPHAYAATSTTITVDGAGAVPSTRRRDQQRGGNSRPLVDYPEPQRSHILDTSSNRGTARRRVEFRCGRAASASRGTVVMVAAISPIPHVVARRAILTIAQVLQMLTQIG